jgi:hypothetical protein
MTRDERLAQLEADLSGGNRVVRMGEIWSRRDGGELNLARFVDVETGDLLFLLRERRELRVKLQKLLVERYETMAEKKDRQADARFILGDGRWSTGYEVRVARARRAAERLRRCAAAVREGRF